MAKAKFSLGSILSLFKSFLDSMSSPISGFDMTDVKVNEKGDVFSSVFSFKSDSKITDISGEPIDYTVLLQALNGKKVLQPLFDNIAKLPDNSVSSGDKAALCAVLGVDFGPGVGDLMEDSDSGASDQNEPVETSTLTPITADDTTDQNFADQQNTPAFQPTKGVGLLGFDFANGDMNQSLGKFAGYDWSWGKIANSYLVYGLECETPGAAFGSIENVKLDRCSDLIAEYLTKTGKLVSTEEIKVDPMTLAKPILMNMQTALIKYFSKVADKITAGDANKKAELADQETEEEQAEKQAQAEKDKMVEVYDYRDDPDGKLVDTVDKTTPEGIAKLQGYAAQGLSGKSGPLGQSDASGNFIPASKHIDVTLKKIIATSEIKLTAINANYNPSEVLDDLEEILDQDDFIDVLTEDPQTFAIDVDEDGFDIEPCDECMSADPCATLCEVFKAGIRAYRNFYIIHWMSSGNDMMKLHLLAEEMYGQIIQEIDTVGELLVEKQGTVPQLDFPCDYVPVQDYDFQTGLTEIKPLIQMYIDCIDLAYLNQDSYVQSQMDEWLAYWNKQLNYFVERQEI